MGESLRNSVAASIDAPVEALPWIPEVFGGLSSLGGSPRLVARWLAEAGIGQGAAVLDLGCGKGAGAVEVARRIGCRVVGVDGFGAFVAAAEELAAAKGVAGQCSLEVGDVRRPARGGPRPTGRAWQAGRAWRHGGFDAAVMIGLFDLEGAAEVLRPLVRAGGVYVIDDCVSLGRGVPAEDAPLTRAEARMLLEERGDRVERERVWRAGEVRRSEGGILAELERRVRAIVRREPAARRPLGELLRRQRASAADLVGSVRPAMWLVRKRRLGGGR